MATYNYSSRKPAQGEFDYPEKINFLIDDLSADITTESDRVDAITIKTDFISVAGTATFTGAVLGNSTTTTRLNNTRAINGVNFDGTAPIDINTYIGSINPTDTSMYPVLVGANSATNQEANTDSGLVYNANTNALSTTTFIGALQGNADTATNAGQIDGLEGIQLARLDVDNVFVGRQDFNDFSEEAVLTTLLATTTFNSSLGTYFYFGGNFTAIPVTFAFTGVAATGRVTVFTVEMQNASVATLTWPAGVVWPNNTEPAWTSGTDIVSFSTRDNGATWHGYFAGGAFA